MAHVAGSISANYWNGSKSVQFRLTDAALAG
jgi:single-stranded-DNA-specific exonuclease